MLLLLFIVKLPYIVLSYFELPLRVIEKPHHFWEIIMMQELANITLHLFCLMTKEMMHWFRLFYVCFCLITR